jgi:protein CpxP
MNRKFGKWLLGASLGTALLASTLGWAQPPGGMDHDPQRMMAHLTSKLDLSEEQQTQVKQLMGESRKALATDSKRMQALREEMKAQAASFNAGSAQKIADEIGEITGRMVFQATKTHAEIYQLLNDQQRQELDELMAKREERRDKRRQGE